MRSNSNRATIMGLVGGYLIYLAYELISNMIKEEATTMPKALIILFAVLFTGIGIWLFFYAWKLWKKSKEEKDEDQAESRDGGSGGKDDLSGPIK